MMPLPPPSPSLASPANVDLYGYLRQPPPTVLCVDFLELLERGHVMITSKEHRQTFPESFGCNNSTGDIRPLRYASTSFSLGTSSVCASERITSFVSPAIAVACTRSQ